MTKITWALIIAHLLSIAYTLLWVIDEKLPLIKANLFLDQSAMPGGIEIGWYIKYITDHIIWCVTFFCFSIVATYYSRKVFLIVTLLGIYHLVDFICFLVNFNQSWWVYWGLAFTIGACIIVLIIPIKEKARVVTLE